MTLWVKPCNSKIKIDFIIFYIFVSLINRNTSHIYIYIYSSFLNIKSKQSEGKKGVILFTMDLIYLYQC